MSFNVSDDVDAVAAAINEFNSNYHADYFNVQVEAIRYRLEPLSTASAERLADPLVFAMKSWGAGKRKAAGCQTVAAVAKALCEPSLHQKLQDLANSFNYLALINGARSLKANAPFTTVGQFDACVVWTLNYLASTMLIGNTSVTYPMKALLLITGLIPAFDSQVKGGLAVAGVGGVNKTSYLLSEEACADMKKICVLPFYIADCVSHSSALLNEAVQTSRYPMLKDQYGRIFDVLLFVQRKRTPKTALITFSSAPQSRQWYGI